MSRNSHPVGGRSLFDPTKQLSNIPGPINLHIFFQPFHGQYQQLYNTLLKILAPVNVPATEHIKLYLISVKVNFRLRHYAARLLKEGIFIPVYDMNADKTYITLANESNNLLERLCNLVKDIINKNFQNGLTLFEIIKRVMSDNNRESFDDLRTNGGDTLSRISQEVEGGCREIITHSYFSHIENIIHDQQQQSTNVNTLIDPFPTVLKSQQQQQQQQLVQFESSLLHQGATERTIGIYFDKSLDDVMCQIYPQFKQFLESPKHPPIITLNEIYDTRVEPNRPHSEIKYLLYITSVTYDTNNNLIPVLNYFDHIINNGYYATCNQPNNVSGVILVPIISQQCNLSTLTNYMIKYQNIKILCITIYDTTFVFNKNAIYSNEIIVY